MISTEQFLMRNELTAAFYSYARSHSAFARYRTKKGVFLVHGLGLS